MIKNNSVLVILFLSISITAFSQSRTIQLNISPSYGKKPIDLTDSSFTANNASSLRIEVLKFYLSNLQLLKNGKVVLQDIKAHLVDVANKNSMQIILDNNENIVFDELKFSLGVDSVTNVSGALGGDLDPTKGMYWTWQSGYINFKLEGSSKLCKTRNNEFQFHLGGYQRPNDCLQTLSYPIHNSKLIMLILNVQKILEQIDLAKTNQLMSPSIEAVRLSKIIANAFEVSGN